MTQNQFEPEHYTTLKYKLSAEGAKEVTYNNVIKIEFMEECITFWTPNDRFDLKKSKYDYIINYDKSNEKYWQAFFKPREVVF